MASIKIKADHEFDGRKLFKHVVDYLPSYARPRFLRIQVRPRCYQVQLSFLFETPASLPWQPCQPNFHYPFQEAQ